MGCRGEIARHCADDLSEFPAADTLGEIVFVRFQRVAENVGSPAPPLKLKFPDAIVGKVLRVSGVNGVRVSIEPVRQ
jgi:hypothetical protein